MQADWTRRCFWVDFWVQLNKLVKIEGVAHMSSRSLGALSIGDRSKHLRGHPDAQTQDFVGASWLVRGAGLGGMELAFCL